jgi:AcrR family transcriptional regulator
MEVKTTKANQSERTREALLRAATRLFAERGYEATFIDDIAHRARVTKGALYHQFRDKRSLFEAVVETRVKELTDRTRALSGDAMERLGEPRKAWPRALAGLEVLLDGLSEPATQRIVLMEGPVVLGRARWDQLWGERVLRLARGIFRDAERRGHVKPELVDPIGHLMYGALQEAVHAIVHADDSAAARQEFGEAARWVLERLLRPSEVDPQR